MKKERLPAEIQYYAEREKWIELMFEARDVSHAEFRVLWFIAKRCSYEKMGSYWTVKRISQECQCSTKTVSDATMNAEKHGYLKILRAVGKENFYVLKFFWLYDA